VLRGAVVVILLGALRSPGCGDVDSPRADVNAPCTRDRDCHSRLACIRGVCTAPSAEDAGDDGAVVPDVDAASDAAAD
jgi:hypothetical protein